MAVTPEDLKAARDSAHMAKHHLRRASASWEARMKPVCPPLTVVQDLASAAKDAGYSIGWLANEVERLTAENAVRNDLLVALRNLLAGVQRGEVLDHHVWTADKAIKQALAPTANTGSPG